MTACTSPLPMASPALLPLKRSDSAAGGEGRAGRGAGRIQRILGLQGLSGSELVRLKQQAGPHAQHGLVPAKEPPQRAAREREASSPGHFSALQPKAMTEGQADLCPSADLSGAVRPELRKSSGGTHETAADLPVNIRALSTNTCILSLERNDRRWGYVGKAFLVHEFCHRKQLLFFFFAVEVITNL